jgi:uncharacterized hydrophobic protein (TIGR00271 family)
MRGHGRLRRHARVAMARLQQGVARALDVSSGNRVGTVVAMLANNARRTPGYWIQLMLSMGIATFGLALDSTAVVIGAMLVSPLMGPLVELGMGFAVGSALLSFRSGLRVLQSIAAVVAGAAVVTLFLPFHEVNGEIAARTAPTALDLLVATCCALTASYTTVRASTDTTAAAAGTAIGIALVPPLCVVGYGLGTRDTDVAAGAALLFVANFSAIMVASVLVFLLLGYNRIDAQRLEHDYLERRNGTPLRVADRAHRALEHVFGSRYGIAMRVGIPALFLATVYVPLEQALEEVAWEVRTRAAVRRVIRDEAPGAVQTDLSLERRTVNLRLLVLGEPATAARVEARLAERIAKIGGQQPSVTVTAVASARELAASIARIQDGPVDDASARLSPAMLQARAGERLRSRWPAPAGVLVDWRLEMQAAGPAALTIRHIGVPLGSTAESMLALDLSEVLGSPVTVTSRALRGDTITSATGDESGWIASAMPLLAQVGEVPGVMACVSAPPARAPASRRRALLVRRALDSTTAMRTGRVTIDSGSVWSVRLAAGTCSERIAGS